MRDRRLGRFKVSGIFMMDAQNGAGANLFRDMVVLETRREWTQDIIEYFAWHPTFDKVPEGGILPLYEATFNSISATPIWSKASTGDGEQQ